ncbi:MAG: quinohemoprotein amine dehydrogenase subunit alpha [Dechloromonas sp.]|uniref:quinohemoprotein amine dehydrogenase subunit alpha n=1 Tax=Dechloromonas sp. TaxID=1917218 RepID=UPI0027E64212|nr:quinohemoprotein amine dehydrogenase subunit alpha [Dechloromonas sp.]MBT9519993.1 quinohemoprotein amine dehydrogenase subunit alpha [Dechloromonas sp.]
MKKREMNMGVAKTLSFAVAGFAMAVAANGAFAAPTGQLLLKAKCQACHAPKEDGGLSRISDGRRTPEGWDMTVARMMYAHGLKMSANERRILVKYLSDTQGLAPEETEGYRYALERRPNVVEHFNNQKVADTCARCHSYARVALQRRSEDDWLKLSHFHVGQYPVIEIQAGGRDRNWWEIASKEIPAVLGKEQSIKSKAWDEWKSRKPNDPSGSWRVAGQRQGVGSYEGRATIKSISQDKYEIESSVEYQDGHIEKSTGTATIFTGYEWRGAVKQGSEDVLQVYSLAKDGNHMAGRWFYNDKESIGADFTAVRDTGQSEIISITPSKIKVGEKQLITINGVALSGEIKLGNGLVVSKEVSRSKEKIVLEVEAISGATEGYSKIDVGTTSIANGLAVYKTIGYLTVIPTNPMARVGGSGGTRPKVPVQLEALAFSTGPDGKKGTADDVNLGSVNAAWKVVNLNKIAEEMEDAKFAGDINQYGLFTPANAGPNPNRKYKTNNAGELRAIATVKDGAKTITGSVPLIVTVQRWNEPPIY